MKHANDVNNLNVYDINFCHCYEALPKQTKGGEKCNFTTKCTVRVAILIIIIIIIKTLFKEEAQLDLHPIFPGVLI